MRNTNRKNGAVVMSANTVRVSSGLKLRARFLRSSNSALKTNYGSMSFENGETVLKKLKTGLQGNLAA
jgi:hypothetical protein